MERALDDVPDKIGDYEVDAVLGQGPRSRAARDVAIKVLKPELARDADGER